MEETQSIYRTDLQPVQEIEQPKQLNEIDDKTYSLVRKIFEGLGLILANIFTLGLINKSLAVRMEYEPVFGISYEDLFWCCLGNSEQPIRNNLVVDPSLEFIEDSEEEESQELPIFDLSKIFPLELTNEADIEIIIPQAIQNSLATLFGIEDVVNKLPVCQKVADDNFSVTDMPSPIMRVRASNGTPAIIFKLKVADPQAYMDNITDEGMLRARAEELQTSNEEFSIDEIFIELKKATLKNINEKIHLFSLAPFDGGRLENIFCWRPRIIGDEEKEPAFFIKKAILTEDNITEQHSGNLVPSAEAQMPEFQKLFKDDGIATDPNGNKWKLAVD